jgi:hypothetical protein
MDEFLPDPDALLAEIEENVAADLASEASDAGSADVGLGDASPAYDVTDLPAEPDPFLEPGIVTETTAWAVQADIPLPDPFTAALAGGGVIGAVSRRRLRRASERKAAERETVEGPEGRTGRDS